MHLSSPLPSALFALCSDLTLAEKNALWHIQAQMPLNPLCVSPQLADEAVCIGEAPSAESYLNIPNIISAAISRGADAIHPVPPPLRSSPPLGELAHTCTVYSTSYRFHGVEKSNQKRLHIQLCLAVVVSASALQKTFPL